MTRLEQELQQFVTDHDAVVTAALNEYMDNMHRLGTSLPGLAGAPFREAASKTQNTLAAYELLAESAEDRE